MFVLETEPELEPESQSQNLNQNQSLSENPNQDQRSSHPLKVVFFKRHQNITIDFRTSYLLFLYACFGIILNGF